MSKDIKILVVDDDPDILSATARIIQKAGYGVIKASTGNECIRKAKESKPDLILLDVVLPDVEGKELCKQIKADPFFKGTFVVLISAQNIASDEQAEGLDVGADGYIARPVSNKELLARIHAMVRIRRAENALQEAHDELEMRVRERTAELQETNRQLQESEKRLSLIYDSVADVVFHIGVEPDDCFRFLSVNDAFLKTTGLTRDQIVGKRVEEVIPEPSIQLVLDNYKKAIKENRIVRWEETSVYPSGEKTGHASIAPVCNENGICTQLVGSVHDITERKRIEVALKTSEQEKSSVLNSTSEIIAFHDTDHRIQWVNKAYLNETGLSLSEIKGKKCYHAWGLDRLCTGCPVSLAMKSGKNYEAELTPQNQKHWPVDQGSWMVRADPVRNDDGDIVGAIEVASNITERTLAEVRLKESEEKFRNLMEQSPLAIMITDPDGKAVHVNSSFLKLWEMTEDTLGEFYEKYNILQDKNAKEAGDMPLIEKAFKDGEVVNLPPIQYDPLEMMKKGGFDKPSGRKRWIQCTIYPTKDEGGRLTNVVHIIEDITERKQSEETEMRFRALIDQTPIAIEIHSVDGKFLTCNPAYSQIAGLHGAELQAVMESYDLRQDEQLIRKGFGPLLEKLYAGETIKIETHSYSVSEEAIGLGIEVADTGSLWIRSVGFPLKNSAGRTEAVVLMTENITAQKMAEIKLATSEEKFRQMLVQSPLAIQIHNLAGYIEDVNQAWMDLWGVREEEMEALKASWCILEDEQVTSLGVMPLVERAFRGERVELPEFEYDAGPAFEKAGIPVVGAKKRWVRTHLYPVLDANGEIKNVVDVEEDITERKQAEERLRNYKDRLRALAAELTIMEEKERRRIATELHDGVAQSLAFARLQLASVKKAVEEPVARTKMDDLSQLLKESLQQIRDVMLDLSSPALNEIGLAAALSDWLEEKIGRRHGLRTSFDDRAGVVTLTDNMRAVLFRNTRELLMNVIRHAKAGKVSVCLETAGDMLRILVKDDGVGFDPEALAGRPNIEGGFGLFSIHESMSDMGGSVEIVSAPGKGTRATLIVPLEEGKEMASGQ